MPTGNRRAVLVELETGTGPTGIGEAGIAYGIGATAAAEMVKAMCERHVLGRDPAQIEAIWNDIYDLAFWTKGGGAVSFAGLSAIEHALWDIKGKDLGVPVYELLGGRMHDSLPVYANGWWTGCDTPAEFAAAGVATVERGYRGLKFYPLGMRDPETVVRHPVRRQIDRSLIPLICARTRELRAAVGPDVDIMLDFGGGLTTDLVLAIARRLEEYDILFIEEPVDPATLGALDKVARNTSIPIATGERFYGRHDFHQLLQTYAVDIIQPDICNTGGILEGKKIAAMAEVYNVRVAPHNYGSTLATAITVQFAAMLPNFMVLEHFPDFDREPDYLAVLAAPLEPTVNDGAMPVPRGPGLGVELDRKNISPHLWSRCAA